MALLKPARQSATTDGPLYIAGLISQARSASGRAVASGELITVDSFWFTRYLVDGSARLM
jgi:hypothetical protein